MSTRMTAAYLGIFGQPHQEMEVARDADMIIVSNPADEPAGITKAFNAAATPVVYFLAFGIFLYHLYNYLD